MSQTDLSHWDSVDSFSPIQLAYLASDRDPYHRSAIAIGVPRSGKARLAHELAAKAFEHAKMVSRMIVEDWSCADEDNPEGITFWTQLPLGGEYDDNFVKTVVLCSSELALKLRIWQLNQKSVKETVASTDSLNFADQSFCRKAIVGWQGAINWQGGYNFALGLIENKDNSEIKTSPAATMEQPHPRTAKNCFSLIAAMAIDKYGYDPEANRSAVPADLAAMLRAKGGSLTDEAIRGYLKEGAGHLNAQKKR